jgi:UDP-3-O-[3-hydroxymyristoyl] glucosamine N-acyltransferase
VERHQLTFLREADFDLATQALIKGAIVIINQRYISQFHDQTGTCIFVNHPEEAFANVLTELFEYPRDYLPIDFGPTIPGIDNSAVIHPGAVIYSNIKVGRNCLIKAGAVVGGPGFGVFTNSRGNLQHFPQIGGVILGDEVEIGSLSTVASGTLGPTEIADYVKIDDHVHIAHNVKIGSNTVITAGVKIAGSVTIGANVWIGVGALIRDGVQICDNTFIGMGSVVTESITKPGKYVGFPARLIPS